MGQQYKERRKISARDKFLRARSNWRRKHRVYFASPAEVRFVKIMRGGALTIPFIRSPRTGYPLTYLWLGRILKGELVEREVRCGRFYLDFATPKSRFLKAIEIDGSEWHMDIVADQEREDYLHERGWQILRIPARRLWREPYRVRADVIKFLRS